MDKRTLHIFHTSHISHTSRGIEELRSLTQLGIPLYVYFDGGDKALQKATAASLEGRAYACSTNPPQSSKDTGSWLEIDDILQAYDLKL